MPVLLALLAMSFFAGVLWIMRSTPRKKQPPASPCLPDDDQPPASAVGWPPEGTKFLVYVDEGCSAIDAYLAGATPPESV